MGQSTVRPRRHIARGSKVWGAKEMGGSRRNRGRPESRYGRRHHGYQRASLPSVASDSSDSSSSYSSSAGSASDSDYSSSDGVAQPRHNSASLHLLRNPRYSFTPWSVETCRCIIATALQKEDARDIWVISKKHLPDSIRWYFFGPEVQNKAYYVRKLAAKAQQKLKEKALGEIPLVGPAVKSVYKAISATNETNADFQGKMIDATAEFRISNDDFAMNSNMMALFRAAGKMDCYGWLEQRSGTEYWLKYTRTRGIRGDSDLYHYFLKEASLYSWEIEPDMRPPLETAQGLYLAGPGGIMATDQKQGLSGDNLTLVEDGRDNPVIAELKRAPKALKKLERKVEELSKR